MIAPLTEKRSGGEAPQAGTDSGDSVLVRRAQTGERAAFEELYRKHAGRAYAFCLRLSGNPTEAEEMTQELFVRAWQNIGKLESGSHFRAWLHRVATNLWLNREGTYIDVEVPEAWFYATDDDSEYHTSLEIFAPFDSMVGVETVNASVEIVDIRNEVEVETVNGTVRVEGGATSVEIETMTGSVEVRAAGAPMSIATISGPVVLHGVAQEVEVETVSAPVEVVGEAIEELQIESTSGTVTFRGSLAVEGHLEIETFSGDVNLALPASVQAHFELTTFSGEIDSALGPKVGGSDRFTPHKKLRFATGLRDFDVTVDTHSADIILRVEGD